MTEPIHVPIIAFLGESGAGLGVSGVSQKRDFAIEVLQVKYGGVFNVRLLEMKSVNGIKNMTKFGAFGALGIVLLGACSKAEPMPEGLSLSGACKVELQSSPKGAEIYLDGIAVGQGEASVEIPCGEKQVLVEKHGYIPYYAYHKVDKGNALKIAVTLKETEKSHHNFALSEEIIEQIHEGQPIWNPAHGPRPEVKEGEESFPAYLGDMKALVATVKGVKAAAAGGGEEEFETGTWDTVEDWR